MPESFSTISSQIRQRRAKMGFGLIIALLLPPIGLLIGIWLIMKGHRLKPPRLSRWGLAIMVLAVISTAGYALLYSNYNERKHRIYPTEYSQDELVACLDKKMTIMFTKDIPYIFNTGDNNYSGRISLTIARVILDQSDGDFVIGAGPNKGNHHLDEGKCPNT